MKFSIVILTVVLLCGCNEPDPKIADMQNQLNVLSNRLAELESQQIGLLTNCQNAIAQSTTLNAKFAGNFDWVLTNLEHLVILETLKEQGDRYHLLNDPATRNLYSATNNPRKLNPDTGLPWMSGEK